MLGGKKERSRGLVRFLYFHRRCLGHVDHDQGAGVVGTENKLKDVAKHEWFYARSGNRPLMARCRANILG